MMDPTSMDDVLREAGMLIENNKATNQMKQSIRKFASLLTCPLCNKVRCTHWIDRLPTPECAFV